MKNQRGENMPAGAAEKPKKTRTALQLAGAIERQLAARTPEEQQRILNWLRGAFPPTQTEPANNRMVPA